MVIRRNIPRSLKRNEYSENVRCWCERQQKKMYTKFIYPSHAFALVNFWRGLSAISHLKGEKVMSELNRRKILDGRYFQAALVFCIFCNSLRNFISRVRENSSYLQGQITRGSRRDCDRIHAESQLDMVCTLTHRNNKGTLMKICNFGSNQHHRHCARCKSEKEIKKERKPGTRLK